MARIYLGIHVTPSASINPSELIEYTVSSLYIQWAHWAACPVSSLVTSPISIQWANWTGQWAHWTSSELTGHPVSSLNIQWAHWPGQWAHWAKREFCRMSNDLIGRWQLLTPWWIRSPRPKRQTWSWMTLGLFFLSAKRSCFECSAWPPGKYKPRALWISYPADSLGTGCMYTTHVIE